MPTITADAHAYLGLPPPHSKIYFVQLTSRFPPPDPPRPVRALPANLSRINTVVFQLRGILLVRVAMSTVMAESFQVMWARIWKKPRLVFTLSSPHMRAKRARIFPSSIRCQSCSLPTSNTPPHLTTIPTTTTKTRLTSKTFHARWHPMLAKAANRTPRPVSPNLAPWIRFAQKAQNW